MSKADEFLKDMGEGLGSKLKGTLKTLDKAFDDLDNLTTEIKGDDSTHIVAVE